MSFFFLKKKTGYERRMSDWSSDVCSSDLIDPRLPVIPVRALKKGGTEAFTAKQREVANKLDKGEVDMGEAQLEIEHYWAGALRRAVIDGDVEKGSLMAGQSVGMVSEEESAAAIVASLVQDPKSVVKGKGVSVPGDPGGSRRIKKKKTN